MRELSEQLRDYVDSEIEPVTANEARDRARGSRSRSRRRRIAATVVVAALGAASLVVLWGSEHDDTSVETGPAGPTADTSVSTQAPPDPGVRGAPRYRYWLSASQVPTAGADLVAVLVNDGAPSSRFGVEVELDRWDGDRWVPHRWVNVCFDHWHCSGGLEPIGEERDLPAIDYSAEPARPGPLMRFRTEGLEPGTYRVRSESSDEIVATGTFEVSDAAPSPAPLEDPDAPSISITPILVPASGSAVELYPLIPPVDGGQSIEDVEAAVSPLSGVAYVERWAGGGWEPITSVPLQTPPSGSSDQLPVVTRTATLPSLEPGDYRLVRRAPSGGVSHPGRFWVVPDAELEPSGEGGSTTSESSAETTPTTAARVSIPDLIGLKPLEAEDALTAAGLSVVQRTVGVVADGQQADATVVWQEAPAGSIVMPGTVVEVWSCLPTDGACPTGPPADVLSGRELTTLFRPVDLTLGSWPQIAESLAAPDVTPASAIDVISAAFENPDYEFDTTTGFVLESSDDRAVLWIATRGAPDDSASGNDYRLTIEARSGGWEITEAEYRTICARGSGADLEYCL